jgi:hypothetical protein
MAVRSAPKPRQRKAHSRSQIKKILEEAFRAEFPHDTVDISDGYKENIHVVVVSRRFDRMKEANKTDLMWSVIDSAPLTDGEKQLISLVYPVSIAEIK